MWRIVYAVYVCTEGNILDYQLLIRDGGCRNISSFQILKHGICLCQFVFVPVGNIFGWNQSSSSLKWNTLYAVEHEDTNTNWLTESNAIYHGSYNNFNYLTPTTALWLAACQGVVNHFVLDGHGAIVIEYVTCRHNVCTIYTITLIIINIIILPPLLNAFIQSNWNQLKWEFYTIVMSNKMRGIGTLAWPLHRGARTHTHT